MSVTIAETTPPREPGAARPASSAPDEPQGAAFAQLFSQTLPTLPTAADPGLPNPSPPGGGEAVSAPSTTQSDAADGADVLNLLEAIAAPQPLPPSVPTPLSATAPATPPAASPTLDSTPAPPPPAALATPFHWPAWTGSATADPAGTLAPVDRVTEPSRPALDARIGTVAVQAAAFALADGQEAWGQEAWREADPEGAAESNNPLPVGRDPGLPLSRTSLAAPLSGTEASDPRLQTRGEETRELATRMGEALGRRLIAEIARGNWQVKLNLNPATLGQIEVSMQMRDGELDASFVAAQAMTRDLLSEGMGRLRETLGSMGMNIANLTVADGHGFQHGGGSTPRPPAHWQQATAEVAEVAPTETVSARLPADSQGLDVIV